MRKLLLIAPMLMLAVAWAGCAKETKTSTPANASVQQETQKQEARTAAEEASEGGTTVGDITVLETVACRSITDRSPVEATQKFPANVGRVYVFTNVKLGTGSESSIKHVWYHGDKEMAKVTLPVRGPRWRTFSSKSIDPTWKGGWRVDVTTSQDQLIQSIAFNVE